MLTEVISGEQEEQDEGNCQSTRAWRWQRAHPLTLWDQVEELLLWLLPKPPQIRSMMQCQSVCNPVWWLQLLPLWWFLHCFVSVRCSSKCYHWHLALVGGRFQHNMRDFGGRHDGITPIFCFALLKGWNFMLWRIMAILHLSL